MAMADSSIIHFMNHGSIDLTAEDIERLAAEVWDAAAKEALAKGLPVTGYHDGYLFRYQPGKGIEVFAPAQCGTDSTATVGSDAQGGEVVAPGNSDDRAGDPVPLVGTGAAAVTEAAAACVDDAVRAGSIDEGSAAEAVSEGAPVRAPAAGAINGQADANESLAEIGVKAIEFARQNANATLELAAQLFAAKTFAQVVALATTHAYKQFLALSPQTNRAEHPSAPAAAAAVAPCKATPPKPRRRKKAARAAGSGASAAP
jgi:hypothetical protein